MKLSDTNNAFNHQIVGGSEYQWSCFGATARFLDYENDYAHASVVFDYLNQTVYEITVNSKDDELKPYRWLNPQHKQSFLEEAEHKGMNANVAWDNVNWVDVEVEEDFLFKAEAIFKGEVFDERVQVPLNLEKEELFKLMALAHERDVTLNQLVEEILWDVINADKKNDYTE